MVLLKGFVFVITVVTVALSLWFKYRWVVIVTDWKVKLEVLKRRN